MSRAFWMDGTLWSQAGNEPFDLDITNPPEVFAAAAIKHAEGAAINAENYRLFRDDPNGNSDGNQQYRCQLWSDLAGSGYADAIRYRLIFLDKLRAPLPLVGEK